MTARGGEINLDFDKIGVATMEVDRLLAVEPSAGFALVGISIRGPQYPGGELLATLRAENAEGDRFVAFHGAFDLGALMRGIVARIKADKMPWREDQWAK